MLHQHSSLHAVLLVEEAVGFQPLHLVDLGVHVVRRIRVDELREQIYYLHLVLVRELCLVQVLLQIRFQLVKNWFVVL